MIGQTDQANHQYDLTDFWSAALAGHMPAVTFLKAKRGQDGHASYSSPLDEQVFMVNTINALGNIDNVIPGTHYASLHTGKYTAADDAGLGSYDQSIEDFKLITPIENTRNS